MEYSTFLNELKTIRISRDISQEELGEKIGVTGQKISAIERGTNAIKMHEYLAICNALQISLRMLLDEAYALKEYESLEESLRNLPERDFRIIKDLIFLMSLSKNDL